MAHRHRVHAKHHAKGGHVQDVVEKAHEEMGEAHHAKRGGRARHHDHHAHGGKVHHRLVKKARGGGVGADKHPYSSAGHHMARGGHAHHPK